MWAVMKKELKSYFYSPIGYVFIGLFLAIFSFIFYITTISQGAVTYQYVFFYSVMYIVIFLIPLLTMRTFAEERKNGTEQLLLTSPRSVTGIVLGKFFAASIVVLITLVISLIYFAILMYFGSPNIVPTLVMMFGFLLLSMAAISIGMFASSITENQIVAAVITAAVLILPWFLPNINTSLEALDLMTNYSKFPAGLLSATEVVGLVSFTIMFIIFTIMVLKRRKAVK
jgi:ABC-2 type transport system permease protein